MKVGDLVKLDYVDNDHSPVRVDYGLIMELREFPFPSSNMSAKVLWVGGRDEPTSWLSTSLLQKVEPAEAHG